MRITVVGRGNLGGGLADLWERAGHRVTRLGRDGGDVSDADAVLVAVPGGAIADAFDRLRGFEGKTVIDATNLYNVTPPAGFASNAEFVKSSMKGPQGVKGRVFRGLGGLGAGSLTAFRRGWVLQSSIRSRGADQSVVRGSGARSSGRPSSGFSEAMTTVELARACASRRGRGRRPCAVRARRSCDRQLLFRARAAAARQATDLSVA